MSNLSRLQFSAVVLTVFMSLNYARSSKAESVCYGTTHNGALSQAFQLPKSGNNFKTYSYLGWLLGRVYVHSKVATVVLQAYHQLSEQSPDKRFMYAETGWSAGGDFTPHKTHQNGLSVDFMVPVKNAAGKSDYLPVGINNKWGYDIEFNQQGLFESYQIDFEAMALHLKLLHEQAESAGFSIQRVYFDPQLQPLLFKTPEGEFIQKHIKFNTQQAWVRHDEHYHVDFDIECLLLK